MFYFPKGKCYVLGVFVMCLFRTSWFMEVKLIFVVVCNLTHKWGGCFSFSVQLCFFHTAWSWYSILICQSSATLSQHNYATALVSSGFLTSYPVVWKVAKFVSSHLIKIKLLRGSKSCDKVAELATLLCGAKVVCWWWWMSWYYCLPGLVLAAVSTVTHLWWFIIEILTDFGMKIQENVLFFFTFVATMLR